MPLWGKKPPDTPGWAYPLSSEQYALFVVTIGDALDALHAHDQRQAIGEGVLRLTNSEGEVNSFGLQNLAQVLAKEPPADWPRLISEHFAEMLTVDSPPLSTDEALKSLRVRIWHPDYVQQLPQAIHKAIAPGLVLALVVDLPKKVMSASPDNLTLWGLTEELAWSVGEENSKREPFEIVPQTGPDGVEMFFLVGDNLYVTSHAIWLSERIAIEPDNGALIGIPTRHLLVVLPIHKFRAIKAVGGMHAANRRIFDEGPGSISPDLFWWRRGKFTPFPIDASTQPMKVRPPDDFVEMLNLLAAAEKG